MIDPTQLANDWSSFLKRNRLICQRDCCETARWFAHENNVKNFTAMTDERRAEVREEIDRYLEAEQQGKTFSWTKSNELVIKE